MSLEDKIMTDLTKEFQKKIGVKETQKLGFKKESSSSER